ncbi:MAG TPA: sorbosone dehydrogenase family protein [Pseudomonadales bacterium]
MRNLLVVLAAMALLLLLSCESARLPETAGYGPDPELPPPDPSLIPTVNVARVVGWRDGEMPAVADGLAVNAFASGLDHPRWLHVLPNGDVLVAESNAPPKEEKGVRAWVMAQVMKIAGAGVPSANRITLLRDADGDGVAELQTPFLDNLMSPFGMALVGSDLYVANADALVRFPYEQGATRITAAAHTVAALPGGPVNHHWTKNVIASPDGATLYVTVGSNSNVGERGMEAEQDRAAILAIDPRSGATRVFASGLRNPNGMAWHPDSGMLWTVVNERDEIGSDLVPDYLTSVVDGGFYGWPYSYYGQHVDERVQPQRPDLVATARAPEYALGAHTASLGLAFNTASTASWPAPFANGAFVGQHGSWNRRPPAGYRVIFVPFENGMPSGMPREVLTGFLDARERARGRPVGVVMDSRGDLLVADDVGNVIWRVAPAQ